jgi:glyoxylase-like metal-dependent hydrolase (beta-lactamase superfamily II)
VFADVKKKIHFPLVLGAFLDLWIDQILVGRFAVFCYLVTEPETREAMVVDPGGEPGKILDRVREREARVRWVVCTHAHPDHVGAAAKVKAETGASVVIHREEVPSLRKMSQRVFTRLLGGKPVGKPDVLVEEGDRLEIGSCEVRVLHTPGHSPGGICLLAEGNLFSGDTLFVGGVGRTDLPGASWGVLSASLREKVLSLPGSTRIWPGHDYGPVPTNLLEAEKLENPFLREI